MSRGSVGGSMGEAFSTNYQPEQRLKNRATWTCPWDLEKAGVNEAWKLQ